MNLAIASVAKLLSNYSNNFTSETVPCIINSFPTKEQFLNNPNSPILILIRGSSGSGKTTLAEKLVDIFFANNLFLRSFSTDDFFETEHGYVFDASKLVQNHLKNFLRTYSVISKGKNVCVHNTFIELWEMWSYIALARELNVHVIIVTMPPNVKFYSRLPFDLKGTQDCKIRDQIRKNQRIDIKTIWTCTPPVGLSWETINKQRKSALEKSYIQNYVKSLDITLDLKLTKMIFRH